MRYFFFGTLRDADVLGLVLGRRLPPALLRPALLRGFRLRRVRGESYPLLAAAPARIVRGALVHGLTGADAKRLAFFEGEEYDTAPFLVEVGARRRVWAQAFRARSGLAGDGRDWRFEAWRRDDKRAFLALVRSWMTFYRHADPVSAEALWRMRRQHGLTVALRDMAKNKARQ